MPVTYSICPYIFENINESIKYHINCKWNIKDTCNGTNVESFFNQIIDLYNDEYDNYRKRIKELNIEDDSIYNLPTRNEFLNKIKNLEKKLKEGDIIRTDNYKGCGQYYVFKKDNDMYVKEFLGDHGTYFPSEVLKYIEENNIDTFQNLESKYNKLEQILEKSYNFGLLSVGISLENKLYQIYYKAITRKRYDEIIKSENDYYKLFEDNDYTNYHTFKNDYVYINLGVDNDDKNLYIIKINDHKNNKQYNFVSNQVFDSDNYYE